MPILDKNDNLMIKKYEDFIKNSPYGNFYQSVNWAKVKNNWDSHYVYLTDDNQDIIAAISIISVKNDGVHSFLYAPRGPVVDLYDTETVNRLFDEVKLVADQTNAFVLSFDPELEYSDSLLNQIKTLDLGNYRIYNMRTDKEKHVNPHLNAVVDLDKFDDYDDFFMSLKSRHRRFMSKSYRYDLTTKRYRLEDEDFQNQFEQFYQLIVDTSKRQDIGVRPKDYLMRLFESFDDVILYTVRDDDDDLLAASIVLNYNRKSFYLYAASSDIKKDKQASYQLNTEAIKDAFDKGIELYDLGGLFELDSSNGLYRFKKKFLGDNEVKEYIGLIDIIYKQEIYDKSL